MSRDDDEEYEAFMSRLEEEAAEYEWYLKRYLLEHGDTELRLFQEIRRRDEEVLIAKRRARIARNNAADYGEFLERAQREIAEETAKFFKANPPRLVKG